jgi:hypothetical protein
MWDLISVAKYDHGSRASVRTFVNGGLNLTTKYISHAGTLTPWCYRSRREPFENLSCLACFTYLTESGPVLHISLSISAPSKESQGIVKYLESSNGSEHEDIHGHYSLSKFSVSLANPPFLILGLHKLKPSARVSTTHIQKLILCCNHRLRGL